MESSCRPALRPPRRPSRLPVFGTRDRAWSATSRHCLRAAAASYRAKAVPIQAETMLRHSALGSASCVPSLRHGRQERLNTHIRKPRAELNDMKCSWLVRISREVHRPSSQFGWIDVACDNVVCAGSEGLQWARSNRYGERHRAGMPRRHHQNTQLGHHNFLPTELDHRLQILSLVSHKQFGLRQERRNHALERTGTSTAQTAHTSQ